MTGGILGSILSWLVTDTMGVEDTGADGLEEPYLLAAFAAKTVSTFAFVLTILGATDCDSGSPHFTGLAAGLTPVLVYIVCIPVMGTLVNPVRGISPTLLAGMEATSRFWLFIATSTVGAVTAMPVWKTIKGN